MTITSSSAVCSDEASLPYEINTNHKDDSRAQPWMHLVNQLSTNVDSPDTLTIQQTCEEGEGFMNHGKPKKDTGKSRHVAA